LLCDTSQSQLMSVYIMMPTAVVMATCMGATGEPSEQLFNSIFFLLMQNE